MFMKSASSVFGIAVAGAIALSSSAFAQTMVGKQQVTDTDMPKVKEYCASLSSGAAASTTGGGNKTGNDGNGGAGSATGGTSTGNGGSAASGGAAPGLDMTAITAEDCKAAGM